MKKLLFAFIPWLFTAFSYKAMAQDVPGQKEEKEKKETQEIIIRRKGEKDTKLVIEMKGDKVTVNGKPLSEFKDDEVVINNRTMTLREGMVFNFGDNMDFDFDFDHEGFKKAMTPLKKTFLGVTTEKTTEGAKIMDVTSESAAGKAGLQKDDVITKIDDKKIDGPEALSSYITSKKPKDNVKISYKRDGKERSTTATLQERTTRTYAFGTPEGGYRALTLPKTPGAPTKPGVRSWNGADGSMYGYSETLGYRRPKLGLKIQDTDESNGVKVLEVEENSAAATAGLKKDDVINEIGGEKVTNTDEARKLLQDNKEKTSYTIKANRGGSQMTFTVKIPKKLKTANL
jgi:serine protease Do